MTNSEKLFERGCKVLPGGVNSPVRAFRAVGGTPRFIVKGLGSHILDADGLEYIDYVGSWGPMILGHGNPEVLRAVHEAVDAGLKFGTATELEIQIAEEIRRLVPSIGSAVCRSVLRPAAKPKWRRKWCPCCPASRWSAW